MNKPGGYGVGLYLYIYRDASVLLKLDPIELLNLKTTLTDLVKASIKSRVGES